MVDRTLERGLGIVVRASQDFIWVDGDDRPFLDLVMAHGAVPFGHTHPKIAESVSTAASTLGTCYPYSSSVHIQLAEKLLEKAGLSADNYVPYFNVSGSLVLEKAKLLARIFTGRSKVAVFDEAYHGVTRGVGASTSANFVDHDLLNTKCDEHFSFHEEGQSAGASLPELDSVGLMMVEPIQGVAGNRVADARMLEELCRCCKDNGTLILSDEIQIGLGRTGDILTWDTVIKNGRKPDMLVGCKSLGGGVFPIYYLLARRELFEAVPRAVRSRTAFGGSGLNHAVGCAVANTVLDMLSEDGVLEDVRTRGDSLLSGLKAVGQESQIVKQVYGRGLAIGLELAVPLGSSISESDLGQRVLNETRKRRLLVNLRGAQNDRLQLLPSLTIATPRMQEAISKIGESLYSVQESLE